MDRQRRVVVAPTWQRADASLVEGRIIVVIDVLRWSTVVLTALANGAERVEAFATPDQARARAKQLGRDDLLLGGERASRPLEGFDVGNSPRDYTPARVRGRPVLTTTTNGTQALRAASGGSEVLVGAFVNLEAIVARLRDGLERGGNATLLCAGQEASATLEDSGCAGAIVELLLSAGTIQESDCEAEALRALAIWRDHRRSAAALMAAAPHAASLRRDGFGADIASAEAVGAIGLIGLLGPDGAVRGQLP